MSIFNPSGGETMKIFVKGMGEVEVVSGGLDPEWQQRFLEDGYEGDADADADEPPFARGNKCPHCGQSIA